MAASGLARLPGDVHLSDGDPTDDEAVAALWREAWASANPQLPSVAPHDHWLARVRAEFRPPRVLRLARQRDRLVGFLVMEPARGYLAQLFIAVDAQSAGLGAWLLGEALQRMPQGGFLHVATGNTGARRFYERQGLVPGAIDLHPVSGRERIAYHWPARSGAGAPGA